MKTFLLIVSILLITIVLMQSSKAESASDARLPGRLPVGDPGAWRTLRTDSRLGCIPLRTH